MKANLGVAPGDIVNRKNVKTKLNVLHMTFGKETARCAHNDVLLLGRHAEFG
jgi:hypothetical protein